MERIGGAARDALQDIADRTVSKQHGKKSSNGAGEPKKERTARGRTDRSGQEKVIKPDELKGRLPHLIALHNKAKEANKDLSDAVKSTAEKSGLLATVVRKVVAAKASDNFDERKKEAEQLELVFGEISG